VLAVGFGVLVGCGLLIKWLAPVYPPDGALIKVAGSRIHLHCQGSSHGVPTLVTEHALGMNAQSFHWLQQELASELRVCRYDRAGIGFSDASSRSRDGETVAADLHELLHRAQVPPPYVLAGHSLGGAYARSFARRYASEVAGLVLIDSVHHRQLHATAHNDGSSVKSPTTVVLALRGLALLADLGLVQLIATFGGLADDGLPPRAAAVNLMFFRSGKHLRATASELAASQHVLAQLERAGSLGDTPLLVITAGEREAAERARWDAMQADLARLSARSAHAVRAGATHQTLLTRRDHAAWMAARIRDLYRGVLHRRGL
jgi:pimeloyl-ACP methyl ester carboxylesterase